MYVMVNCGEIRYEGKEMGGESKETVSGVIDPEINES